MKTCLIVDDSKVVRKVIRKMVEDLGFRVLEAGDGQEALSVAGADVPDVVLLDWNMPVMDGLTCLKEMRKQPWGESPIVIFCTTENEQGRIMEAISQGANEYIMKPFDHDIIRGKLEQVGVL